MKPDHQVAILTQIGNPRTEKTFHGGEYISHLACYKTFFVLEVGLMGVFHVAVSTRIKTHSQILDSQSAQPQLKFHIYTKGTSFSSYMAIRGIGLKDNLETKGTLKQKRQNQ
jgi:hypothetical protein